MLFLESPVGVGFSYTLNSSDFVNLGDDFTGMIISFIPLLNTLINRSIN